MIKCPKGFHSVTPYLLTDRPEILIEFLSKAFDATEIESHRNPQGKITHGVLKIGDSMVMIGGKADEKMPQLLYLYVEDVDRTYQQALTAGGTTLMEPQDQFYGDRNAAVQDPCGHRWWIATHLEDLSQEELAKRAKAFYNKS